MNRYRIVVALDGSQYAQIVLEHAFDQAARHEDADLHLVRIIDAARDAEAAKSWLAGAALEALEAFSSHQGSWRTRLHVRAGKPADEIANLAAEVDADLLVIGNYGLHRKSVAERVIARTSCPTLVVGLSGHVETVRQCPDCVDVRAKSDGERWFCKAHSSPSSCGYLRYCRRAGRSHAEAHCGSRAPDAVNRLAERSLTMQPCASLRGRASGPDVRPRRRRGRRLR